MIKTLLERGADVNKGDRNGKTALMRAAEDGHIETIECLLNNAYVAINQRTQEGLTALMFAVRGQENNEDIVKIFLRYGADVDQQDIRGRTALMIAITLKKKSIIKS